MNRSEQLAVRGIVAAIGWDDGGNVTRVALMTRDEQEFELEAAGVEEIELLDLSRLEVVAFGSLGPTREGRRILRVTKIATME